MRIRDWSSDVCSSDLYPDIEVRITTSIRPADLEREGIDCAIRHGDGHWPGVSATRLFSESLVPVAHPKFARGKEALRKPADQIGRASCRESVCQYVYLPVAAGSLNNKKQTITM